jgi:hypothetical protein
LKIESANLTLGYSYCLRANIWTWNMNVLVESESLFRLRFNVFTSKVGFLTHAGLMYSFSMDGPEALPRARTTWTSFCVSFEAAEGNLGLAMNGRRYRNAREVT